VSKFEVRCSKFEVGGRLRFLPIAYCLLLIAVSRLLPPKAGPFHVCILHLTIIGMFTKFQIAAKYLRYYLTASNGRGHGTHSPFIYYVINEILNDRHHYEAYDAVEELRKELLIDQRILQVEDFGAGSSSSGKNQRTISSIAMQVAKSRKYGELLFRFAYSLQPEYILELGTSIGISTCYLASAHTNTKIISCEGSKEISEIARENFSKLDLNNIELITGNFDNTLSAVVDRLPQLDLVFFDGNHRKEPTIRYFKTCLEKIKNDSIFIFDDIHWSREMEDAWEIIRNDPEVRCTIDLFFAGIVLFRSEFKEKQHFKIRF
jgi:predicted O-methyltransferase YrrM